MRNTSRWMLGAVAGASLLASTGARAAGKVDATGIDATDLSTQKTQPMHGFVQERSAHNDQASHSIQGRVVKVEPFSKRLEVLDAKSQHIVLLDVTKESKVQSADGGELKLRSLAYGSEVRASYMLRGDSMIVQSLEVMTPAGRGGSGADKKVEEKKMEEKKEMKTASPDADAHKDMKTKKTETKIKTEEKTK